MEHWRWTDIPIACFLRFVILRLLGRVARCLEFVIGLEMEPVGTAIRELVYIAYCRLWPAWKASAAGTQAYVVDASVDPSPASSVRLVAPSTVPLILYRLLKKVNQSASTFLCSADKSCHSGRQSSGLRDDWARARDASLPAKTT